MMQGQPMMQDQQMMQQGQPVMQNGYNQSPMHQY
jgi:hypothetical protein